MKYGWLIFLLYLWPRPCASQQHVKGFSPFFLGDSIARFKSSLLCAQYSYLNQPYSDSTKCVVYRFVPVQNDSFPIGPVIFFSVALSTDEQKKINMILYSKSYPGEGSVSKEKDVQTDFEALKSHFELLFQMEGRKKVYPENKSNSQEGLIWKSGRYSLALEKNSIKRKRIHKNLSLLDVTLLKE